MVVVREDGVRQRIDRKVLGKSLQSLAGADATRLDAPSGPRRAKNKTGSSKDSTARKPRKV